MKYFPNYFYNIFLTKLPQCRSGKSLKLQSYGIKRLNERRGCTKWTLWERRYITIHPWHEKFKFVVFTELFTQVSVPKCNTSLEKALCVKPLPSTLNTKEMAIIWLPAYSILYLYFNGLNLWVFYSTENYFPAFIATEENKIHRWNNCQG